MTDERILDAIDNPDTYDAVRTLHALLFPEEHDYVYDSIADLYDRRSGKNPMNEEYIKRVDNRRVAAGFKPLNSVGYPEDDEAMTFIKNAVELRDVGALGRILTGLQIK